MQDYGIEWEKLGTHEQHLDVLDYKKKMRAREVAVLESKIDVVERQLKSRKMILNDADNAIEQLDKKYAEKSEAVKQLDSDIEDKTAKLESTTKQLAADQLFLQVTLANVAQINDIDSIEVNVQGSVIRSRLLDPIM